MALFQQVPAEAAAVAAVEIEREIEAARSDGKQRAARDGGGEIAAMQVGGTELRGSESSERRREVRSWQG